MRAGMVRMLYVVSSMLLGLSFGLAACDSDKQPQDLAGPDSGPPRLTVLFAGSGIPLSFDASPSLFSDDELTVVQAWLKIEDICLQGVPADDMGEGGGRQCLLAAPTDWIEVAGPSAEWETLVDGVEVPLGTAQLRFIIADVVMLATGASGESVYASSNEALADLNTFLGNDPPWTAQGEAHCPSCSSSGLKVIFPGGDPSMQNGLNTLAAQFNVAESFGRLRGNSGRWVWHPVVRGSLMSNLATIHGTVSASGASFETPCGGADVDEAKLIEFFRPLVSNGETKQATTDPASGSYEISVLPGTYTAGFFSPVPFPDDMSSAGLGYLNVTVTEANGTPDDGVVDLDPGETAMVDYEIVEAECT